MTLDETLAEATERGAILSYLRQRDTPHGQYTWEALFRAPILIPRDGGYIYTTGYGVGYTAAEALDSALDTLLNKPEFAAPTSQPTSMLNMNEPKPPAFDLAAFLSGSNAYATGVPVSPTFKVRL